jgi:hypothetical protein
MRTSRARESRKYERNAVVYKERQSGKWSVLNFEFSFALLMLLDLMMMMG